MGKWRRSRLGDLGEYEVAEFRGVLSLCCLRSGIGYLLSEIELYSWYSKNEGFLVQEQLTPRELMWNVIGQRGGVQPCDLVLRPVDVEVGKYHIRPGNGQPSASDTLENYRICWLETYPLNITTARKILMLVPCKQQTLIFKRVTHLIFICRLTYSAKRWRLGCVFPHPCSLWTQGEFTQPSIPLLAEFCTWQMAHCYGCSQIFLNNFNFSPQNPTFLRLEHIAEFECRHSGLF